MISRKHLLFYSFTFLLVLIIGVLTINYAVSGNDGQLKVEAELGHNVFLILSGYNDLSKMTNQDLGIEDIMKMEQTIDNIKSPSLEVDNYYGNHVLGTLADNIGKIVAQLKNDLEGKRELTPDLQNLLVNSTNVAEELIILIYYKEDAHKEAKIKINGNDFQPILDLNQVVKNSI